MTWRTLHTHSTDREDIVLAPWWAEGGSDESPVDDEEPPPSQG